MKQYIDIDIVLSTLNYCYERTDKLLEYITDKDKDTLLQNPETFAASLYITYLMCMSELSKEKIYVTGLEEDIQTFIKDKLTDKENASKTFSLTSDDIEEIAKHFFDLGIKTKNNIKKIEP